MHKIITISALGGSGTRVVAQILINIGIYMGDELNHANDNLIFTRLFKNPEWVKNATKEDWKSRLAIFEKYMIQGKLSMPKLKKLFIASINNPTYSSNYQFFFRMIRKKKLISKNKIWGWKEPNTQHFIPQINNYFPNFRLIHVLRNGLDMAFSKNKQQLKNWGFKYNIFLNGFETEEELAVKQLDFWIESTKEVLEKSKLLNSRFYLLNYSNFCKNPTYEINSLLDFIEEDIPQTKKEELFKIPVFSESNNRYKSYDLSIFSIEQLNFVKSMGFNIS